jgi:hypothetical protein
VHDSVVLLHVPTSATLNSQPHLHTHVSLQQTAAKRPAFPGAATPTTSIMLHRLFSCMAAIPDGTQKPLWLSGSNSTRAHSTRMSHAQAQTRNGMRGRGGEACGAMLHAHNKCVQSTVLARTTGSRAAALRQHLNWTAHMHTGLRLPLPASPAPKHSQHPFSSRCSPGVRVLLGRQLQQPLSRRSGTALCVGVGVGACEGTCERVSVCVQSYERVLR